MIGYQDMARSGILIRAFVRGVVKTKMTIDIRPSG